MIQKTLVFVVDFTGKMIDGEKPVGFLRANDKNKNTIFLITPEQPTTQIKARFLAKTKHNDGVAVNGILTTDYKVNDLVSETKSYYEKIKDWNVFYFPVPERVVNYIASNAGSEIGITFEFIEWQLPRIKDIYGDFLGEITDRRFSIDANEDGYYVNRVIDYEYNGDKYGYNDLFIVGGGTITAIRAFPRTGGAVGGYFGVDPMYDSGVFEYVDEDDIDPSITTQIKNQVNNLTSEVYFLNVDNEKNKTDIATLKTQVSDINVDIVDLDNRVNDNASDIIDLGDDLVNTIKSTCANKLDLAYSSSNNRIAITLKSSDGTSLDADLIDLPKATTTSDGLMSKEDKVFVNGLPSALLLKENKSEKGIANGYASLDGNAKIPTSQLPDSILGQLEYKGTFNPSSGYPVSPEKGWFYIAIANALISGVDYKVGDWAVYNGVSWDKVDNTDAVASVNGKLGVVILYGTEIQVGNGDTWTVEQRIVDIYAELNSRYTKAQTYSNAEIEQRLTDLLGLANLQDTAVEFSAGFYDLSYNGLVVSPFAYSLVSPYNWVILQVLVGTQAEYTIFKPSEATNGVVINLPLTQKDVYAEIVRNGSNFEFSLKKKNDNTLDTTTATIKAWGIKLDGIDASDISYNNETVESALDSLLVPAYITATHEALQNEITATNAFEINDETGDVIKITGNEPTNLVVNGDFNDGVGTWSNYSGTILSTISNKLNVSIATINGTFRQENSQQAGDYYAYLEYDTGVHSINIINIRTFMDGTQTNFYQMGSNLGVNKGSLSILNNFSSFNRLGFFIYTGSSTNVNVLIDNIKLYNVSQMKLKGIKNDNGILFANLTNEEIKEQLDIWVQNGFPTVVEKLVSKSDNLFNAEFNTISSLDSENLVQNGDLILDSDSDNIPDGFTYRYATDISLTNGVAKFTATANLGRMLRTDVNIDIGETIYYFARVKTSNDNTQFYGGNTYTSVPNTNSFEFISAVRTPLNSNNIQLIGIYDNSLSNFTPIEVDYIGAINITDLVKRGILPSGLTNNEYKEMIDNAMFTNVPLRETNYIAVEPSKAYKLIKVSSNEVTHKVIEYTTDNQIVKVTPVVYTTNKFTFTTNALTSKIKIVSDMLERPTQLLTNPNFDNGTTGWNIEHSSLSVSNGVLTIIPLGTQNYAGFWQSIQWTAGEEFYNKVRVRATTPNISIISFSIRTNANKDYIPSISDPVQNQWYEVSAIYTPNVKAALLKIIPAKKTTITNEQFVDERVEVDYRMAYNITDFKKAGVVNDSGTLFSRLTNDEIKDQMDIWTEVGFPDHVIHALYPNGVDSAIALKYNDADDVFRPQQIDELPLNLTLRSGEYWQDGYVVKQNGNAEYYPLDTKFSAWNYGQLEAVYTSGVPADFDIQYAQNAASQVKTTQEFVVEAREQLDYVTDGYDNLVEKLGDAIFSDKYDSYAGITSDTYEYYTLEGVKEGNTLAIEGAGQSIQNLLGKGGTINATTTVRGITVTYDSVTGVFTANGTATAGSAFNITLATGMDFGLPVGTPMQLMRYYDDVDGGTVDLNGSYIGYVLLGTTASNRINENSEALYDPYINGSGNLNANDPTNKQQVVLQVWAPGIVFTNFKFKIGIYEGLQLRPFILPSGEPAKSNVTVYNRTANKLNMPTALNIEDSGLILTYDPLVQEFLLSGTATATKDISLNATFNVLSGDRLSIKRLYQSGDITAAGGTLPRLKLVNSGGTAIVYNDIYKMTAPEGQTPTPDVSFNTGTAPADATLTLKLGITNGQVFDNYRFRLMIHDKSTDIGYVAYRRDSLGNMSVGANERAVIEFKAIPYGILEFVADSESLNLLFADGITDLNKTYLEYNAGIISPNRKISELTARAELIDNPFRNKVIAVWGDSRESNNPTSDPSGVGDQKDTSWPALLAKKLSATVLNFGLSGGAWAENTFQQDAASAIVNRVQTEDVSASADVIVISSMNDFKLASVLGSPLPANKDKTTFYGAMRLTYDRLATKYPGKKIVLVLPQKRYDETVNYGGGSYYHYLKAQVEVANEYGIPIVDLYHNLPNTKPTFYDTYMLNDTHFSAVGNDRVAELVARELIGNGNKGDMDVIPPIPTTDGTYTLKVTITGGIPVFSWVA